jgi:hypothetical protein
MNASQELRSKWVDGPLAIVLILALTAGLILLIRSSQALGDSGQVAYMLVCLGLSLFSLRGSLAEKAGEMRRAWLGLCGGMLAWAVIEMAQLLGFAAIEDAGGSVLFLLAACVLGLLWQSLPLGARFWMALFFMNWAGHVLIFTQRFLAQTVPVFTVTEKAMGFLAGLGIPVVFGLIFIRATSRVQRLWGAVWVWFLTAVIYYVFRG